MQDMANAGLSRSRHQPLLDSKTSLKVKLAALAGHMLAACNAEDAHLGVIAQTREELRGDEEVLARVFATCDLYHTLVNHAFVAGVHSLVDLVDDAERGLGHGLESHEEEDCRHGTFTARLAVRCELLKSLVLTAGDQSVESLKSAVCERDLPETDHNIQGPGVKVLGFVYANFARTANLLKIVRKGVVDFGD